MPEQGRNRANPVGSLLLVILLFALMALLLVGSMLPMLLGVV